MKSPYSRTHLTATTLAILCGLALSASAQTTAIWDPSNTGNSGGTGNWSTSDDNWYYTDPDFGLGDYSWPGSTYTAQFGGSAGTVTLTSAIEAAGMVFTTTGYTIATGSNTLTLDAGGIDASALSSGTTTITGTVALNAAQSWNVGSGSTLASSAVLSGTGSLTKTGLGTLLLSASSTFSGGLIVSAGNVVLSATNTFAGGLTINGGNVAISSNTALGGTGGTSGAVTLNGGVLSVSLGSTAMTNTHGITIGANGGTIQIATPTSGTPTYTIGSGLLTGSGTLTISGNGTLGLAGAKSSVVVFGSANTGFTGNVVLQNGGIIEYANASGVSGTSAFTVNNNGMLSANNVTIANNITLNAGSGLAFQNTNSGVFSGNITLAGNAFIRMQDWWSSTVRNGTITGAISGAYTLDINSGNNAGTGGTLTLAGFGATASSANLVLDGASLAVNSGSGTAASSVVRANSLTINTGNLNVAGVASQNTNDIFGTLNLGGGSASTSGAGILQGYSTWTLSPNAATNTALTFTNMGTRSTGSWVALNGTLGTAGNASTSSIYFTNGLSGSNLIGAGGSITSGTASVIPWLHDTGGGNIYGYDPINGVQSITTLNVNPDSATSDQNINWNAAATLTANRTVNSFQAAFSNVNLGGYTLTINSGVLTADNATFSNGTLNFGTAEAEIEVHQARTLNISAAVTGSSGLTFVGYRINNGNAGALILGGANTYTGVTNFYGYGATTNVYLTNSLALQNTTLNHVAGRGYNLVFGNGGTSGQTAYTFGGLAGNANLTLANNNTTVQAVALTVGSAADTDSTTYSGVLSDGSAAGGSLVKAGSGTLTLAGANTYTGSTTVNSGTLALASTGSLVSTSYIINSGATFDVSAKAGYSLANVATTLGINGGTNGFINAGTGILTLGNTLTINFTSTINTGAFDLYGASSVGGDFSSVTLTGLLSGSLALSSGTWFGTLDGYDLSLVESTGVLTVASAIPEPSACAAFLGLAGLAFAAYRRRKA